MPVTATVRGDALDVTFVHINGDTHVYGVYGFVLNRGIQFYELLGQPKALGWYASRIKHS